MVGKDCLERLGKPGHISLLTLLTKPLVVHIPF